MANFVLNTKRTFKQPVPIVVHDEDGNEVKGEFTAEFKVLPNDRLKEATEDNGEARLMDLALVAVYDIDVLGDDNKSLVGDELTEAVKNDPSANLAMCTAYHTAIGKKNRLKI